MYIYINLLFIGARRRLASWSRTITWKYKPLLTVCRRCVAYTRVRGYEGTRVRGNEGTRVRGYEGTRVRGYEGTLL